MSGAPLHIEAPAPVPARTHEIDRSGEPVFELTRRLAQLRPQQGHLRRQPFASGRARSWGSSATTAPASRRCSRSSPATSSRRRARSRFMGKDVRFRTPADARAMGIEAVYQDLAIVDQLSLWRNFFLGKEIVKKVGPLTILQREPDAAGGAEGDQPSSASPASAPPTSRYGRCRAASGSRWRSPARCISAPSCCFSTSRRRRSRCARRATCCESIGRAREHEARRPLHRPQHGPCASGRRPHRAARARPRRARDRPRRGERRGTAGPRRRAQPPASVN